MYFDPMKPHCLPCPYKPPLEREKVVAVREVTGEEKERAMHELFAVVEDRDLFYRGWRQMSGR